MVAYVLCVCVHHGLHVQAVSCSCCLRLQLSGSLCIILTFPSMSFYVQQCKR